MPTLSKQDLMDQLTALGITFDPAAKSAVLAALLKNAQAGTTAAPETDTGLVDPEAAAPAADTADDTSDDDAPEDAPADNKKSVDVLRNGNLYVRTYSQAVHGKDYAKMAEEFAGKESYADRNYSVVPSASVPQVKVDYREKEDAHMPAVNQNPDAPQVDKSQLFTDKEAALQFNLEKKGTITVVLKVKKQK